MAKKTNRKLSIKKETLRALDQRDLDQVVGGLGSGLYCTVGQNSGGGCGSQTYSCDGGCLTVVGGSLIWKN